MKEYVFFRLDDSGNEYFYSLQLPNDRENLLDNIICNQGTIRVEDLEGNVLWREDKE